MCGITGIFLTQSGSKIDPAWLGNFAKVLRHRGPDDVGFLGGSFNENEKPILTRHYLDIKNATFGLAHTRLSIIDIEHGFQPMADPSSRYFIIYNGEVYNFLDIRKQLEKLGYRFTTESDTEVILKAYAHFGKKCLSLFEGMFAFAILDLHTKHLFLARDPFGIKPLYYIYTPHFFAFASEIKALLSLPGVKRELNVKSAKIYLASGITDRGEETFFQNIISLPSSHYIDIDMSRLPNITFKKARYWSPSKAKIQVPFREAEEQVRTLLFNSVSQQLRSDVPVGATLSGGLDSSSIVMLMQQLSSSVIPTFSYIAEDTNKDVAISEEKWIDLFSAKIQHHKTSIAKQTLLEELDDTIYAQDEPFGSTSIIAQRYIFKHAAQAGIKVTLDGQGADEVFAGYPLYLSARLLSYLKNLEWRKALHFVKKASEKNNVSTFYIMSRLIKMKSKDPLFSCLNQTMYKTLLPSLLRYIDRNAMRFSVESRVPYLNKTLVNFVHSLPEEYLISKEGQTKVILRAAMQDLVPEAILNRNKMSFQTPEGSWLSFLNPWAWDIVHRDKVKEFNFINCKALKQAIKTPHMFGERKLWRYLNFIRWAEIYNVTMG